jgi:hypothetical protein
MFDLDDPYWERYFGKDGKGKISEAELGLIFGVRHTPHTTYACQPTHVLFLVPPLYSR